MVCRKSNNNLWSFIPFLNLQSRSAPNPTPNGSGQNAVAPGVAAVTLGQNLPMFGEGEKFYGYLLTEQSNFAFLNSAGLSQGSITSWLSLLVSLDVYGVCWLVVLMLAMYTCPQVHNTYSPKPRCQRLPEDQAPPSTPFGSVSSSGLPTPWVILRQPRGGSRFCDSLSTLWRKEGCCVYFCLSFKR